MTPETRYAMLQSIRTEEQKHAAAIASAKDAFAQGLLSVLEAHLGRQTLALKPEEVSAP